MKLVRYILVLQLLVGTLSLHSQVLKGEKVSFQLNNAPEVEVVEVPDAKEPAITIISPELENGVYYKSAEPEVVLIGKISAASGISVLSIGSKWIEFNDEGGFVSTIELEPGQNRLRIVAMDKNDNLKEKTLFIDYTPPEPTLADKIRDKSVYYALVIGIDEYEDYRLRDLENPVKDCVKFIESLTKNYTFEEENITFLRNATREELIGSLDDLTQKVTPEDNLLIFYAGHGMWDEKSNNGYWLPSDAEREKKTNWVRNSAVIDYLTEIDSKHTLLITDACFGGSIFETRAGFADDELAYEQLYEHPSRKAMTSGNKTEVPDRSAFTRYLINQLNENKDTYLSSATLFNSFRLTVIKNSKAIPQYGNIGYVGDQGGDFIFLKRE
ncbi:MAG: caspase family protein [Bacteroidales bacterium]|nr:caspase family protein [Bacteroidales bacterium]